MIPEREDRGQLLLLAGIVLVLAFVVTAFTLSQVADVEKQAAQEQESGFITEYRFVRSKLGTILDGNTGRTTDNLSFNSTFTTTVGSFRNTLGTKGYDVLMVLAGNTTGVGTTECMLLWEVPASPATVPTTRSACDAVASTDPTHRMFYETSEGGVVRLNHTYDGVSDGVLWMCDQTSGSIVGAVVHLYMSDGRTSISETLVYPLNHDWFRVAMAKNHPERCQ